MENKTADLKVSKASIGKFNIISNKTHNTLEELIGILQKGLQMKGMEDRVTHFPSI
jgi:hypothetical protein